MVGAPRSRRHDPRRRERIADAAEAVIASRGIEGLTHRAVAELADVPLGSTTYHFADRDDLIRVALERATDRYERQEREWAERHAGLRGTALAEALADHVLRFCTPPERERSVVAYELYIAALRRPALRAVANRYPAGTARRLAGFTDPATAGTLTALLDGLTIRGLLAERPPDRAELVADVLRVLGP